MVRKEEMGLRNWRTFSFHYSALVGKRVAYSLGKKLASFEDLTLVLQWLKHAVILLFKI